MAISSELLADSDRTFGSLFHFTDIYFATLIGGMAEPGIS